MGFNKGMPDYTKEKLRLKEYLKIKGLSYNSVRNTWRCPNHEDTNESAVYYNTGKNSDTPVLWCPVCQESWSIFEVAGIMEGVIDFKDKLKIVRDALNIESVEHTEIKKKEKQVKQPLPFPEDKDKINLTIRKKANEKKWGNIKGSWKYFNKDAEIIAFDVRFEKEGERKNIITFWYDGLLKWYSAPVFIYNLHMLSNNKPIIIHEGCKCADIGNKELSEFVHLSWSGGSGKTHLADWSILKGKEVYILPDDDIPGQKAAKKIKDQLPHAKIIDIVGKAREIKSKGADIEEILQVMTVDEFKQHIKDKSKKQEGKEIDIFIQGGNNEETKIDVVKQALSASLIFRKNVVTGKIEFANKKNSIFETLNDYYFNSIRMSLLENCVKTLSKGDLNMIIDSNFTPKYCPITEYIHNLKKWDERTDYIQQLSGLVQTKKGQFGDDIDADNVFYDYLRRWLVGNVSTMLQIYENHNCLTLVGPQGIGKTTFLRNLGIDERFTYVGAMNPADKDSKIKLSEKTLIVLDELEATTRFEMSQLKSNMTLRTISVRRPYAIYAEELPRRASFCACANDTEILSDMTGSRRWLCVEVEKIDYKAVNAELMRKVYSQALYMLENNFEYWKYDEVYTIEDNNQQFNFSNPEEEALLDMFYKPKTLFDGCNYYTNTQILNMLAQKNQGVKFVSKRLGQVLKKHGFTRVKRDGLYRYAIEKKLE